MVSKKPKDSPELKVSGTRSNFDAVKTILVLLLVVAAIGWFNSYQKYNQTKRQLATVSDPKAQQEKIKAEAKDLTERVGKLMVLPEGEPTVATVADSQALAKEQPFFKDAQNGDKVLIYKDKAIIYNPTENKIINVGPIYLSKDAPAAPADGAALTVEVRNGSKKIGAANELGEKLKSAGYNVSAVANAANSDYQGTLLINLGSKDVSALEKELGVTAVKELPAGETASTQEALIILGNR